MEVYGHVALACERAKNWRQLMWTFDEMQLRELVPGLSSYNRAIRGCTQEGEWEMAVSLVLGTLGAPVAVCFIFRVDRHNPNARGLPHATARHPTEADRRGLALDRESFETALGAVATAKQPARARGLLKAMREAGVGKPEEGLLATVVELCRELGEAALAEEIARDFGFLP